ncbi:MAG TPA: methyltransferase [Candidatus Binataceae bacterium]|jgi:SAM-dependent methyltransferase|nr:methyltransferase [Candidatus Binataceae bacterium]
MEFSTIAGMAGGHAEARAIQIALKLGIFERLSAKALDANALAPAIDGQPRATAILCNALVALGLLHKIDGRYQLDQSAQRFLVESSPEYLGGMILFDAALWDEWGRLEDSIRTGAPARAPDMFQSTPAATARFIRAMDSLVRARGDDRWTAEHLDLGAARNIADLGGGPGTYLVEFLRRYPDLRGAIWDLAATLEVAREILTQREAAIFPRIDLTPVDYLAGELPGPVDAIFMSNIIHSESEPVNETLIAKCFRALAPGGLIAIKDHIMNRDLTEPAAGAVFSLYLLLTTRGRDYSLDETAGWLNAAGFGAIQMTTLPSPPFTSSIVSARKP